MDCLPWFQEIWSPVRKLVWILRVAEKKFPPALHVPHDDPGSPRSPMIGTRESSRLVPACPERGQAVPSLTAGVMPSVVMPSPAQAWTVSPSVTLRYKRWKEPNTSFTKLLVTTAVSFRTAEVDAYCASSGAPGSQPVTMQLKLWVCGSPEKKNFSDIVFLLVRT